MTAHVRRIVELVGPDHAGIVRFGQFGGEAFRVADIISRVLVRLCRHEAEIGSENAKHILLFLTLRFRHHYDRRVALRIADHRQPDSRIAGRAFDDHAALAKRAALFRLFDDGKGGAVLHGPARVHEFGFAIDIATGCLGHRAKADQRGVADGVQQILRVWIVHHVSRSRLSTI